MMFDFGDEKVFRCELTVWLRHFWLERRKSYTATYERAAELAQWVHGLMSADEFFKAWDAVHVHHACDNYAPYPDRFLKYWCKDAPEFRRECRRLWADRKASIMDSVDYAIYFDLLVECVIDLLRLGLWYGASIALAQGLGIALDTQTFALLIAIFSLVWIMSAIGDSLAGIGWHSLKMAWYRFKIMRARRATHE